MFLCVGILENASISSSPTFKVFNFLRLILYGYGFKSSKNLQVTYHPIKRLEFKYYMIIGSSKCVPKRKVPPPLQKTNVAYHTYMQHFTLYDILCHQYIIGVDLHDYHESQPGTLVQCSPPLSTKVSEGRLPCATR